jgi:hypothetical protein
MFTLASAMLTYSSIPNLKTSYTQAIDSLTSVTIKPAIINKHFYFNQIIPNSISDIY